MEQWINGSKAKVDRICWNQMSRCMYLFYLVSVRMYPCVRSRGEYSFPLFRVLLYLSKYLHSLIWWGKHAGFFLLHPRRLIFVKKNSPPFLGAAPTTANQNVAAGTCDIPRNVWRRLEQTKVANSGAKNMINFPQRLSNKNRK